MTDPVDLNRLWKEVEALFLEFPELRNDDELRLDVIHGQTDAVEILEWLTEKAIHAQGLQAILTSRKKDLDARKARYENHEQAYRRMMLKIMEICELKKIPLPIATLSIRQGVPGVRIIDQAIIPEPYWRIKREPNLTDIKEALKKGTDVPGTALSNPSPTLAILTR